MKKISLVVSVFTLALTGFSQPSKTDLEKAKAVAGELCDCASPILSKLHPYIWEMIEVTIKKGEEEAEKTLKARLEANPKEKEKFLASSDFMQSEQFGTALDSCSKKLEAKFPGLDDENMDEALEIALKQLPKCKYFYMLYQLGLKDEEEDD